MMLPTDMRLRSIPVTCCVLDLKIAWKGDDTILADVRQGSILLETE